MKYLTLHIALIMILVAGCAGSNLKHSNLKQLKPINAYKLSDFKPKKPIKFFKLKTYEYKESGKMFEYVNTTNWGATEPVGGMQLLIGIYTKHLQEVSLVIFML